MQKLDVKTLLSAFKIFEDNDWSIHGGRNFERFCKSLEFLEKEERELFFQLTEKFLWYTPMQYHNGLRDLFNNLYDGLFNNYSKIFIFPLLSQKDIEKPKIKSSHFVYYSFKNIRHNLSDSFDNITFTPLDVPVPGQGLAQADRFNRSPNRIIVLLDDFIGSGDTASSAVKYLSEYLGYDKKKIVVLSLVAQKLGIERLKKEEILVHSKIIRTKGITDNFRDDDLARATTIMESIEEKLHVGVDKQFGYKRTEALVKMERTPNNTFPVYWFSPPDVDFKATFPR